MVFDVVNGVKVRLSHLSWVKGFGIWSPKHCFGMWWSDYRSPHTGRGVDKNGVRLARVWHGKTRNPAIYSYWVYGVRHAEAGSK